MINVFDRKWKFEQSYPDIDTLIKAMKLTKTQANKALNDPTAVTRGHKLLDDQHTASVLAAVIKQREDAVKQESVAELTRLEERLQDAENAKRSSKYAMDEEKSNNANALSDTKAKQEQALRKLETKYEKQSASAAAEHQHELEVLTNKYAVNERTTISNFQKKEASYQDTIAQMNTDYSSLVASSNENLDLVQETYNAYLKQLTSYYATKLNGAIAEQQRVVTQLNQLVSLLQLTVKEDNASFGDEYRLEKPMLKTEVHTPTLITTDVVTKKPTIDLDVAGLKAKEAYTGYNKQTEVTKTVTVEKPAPAEIPQQTIEEEPVKVADAPSEEVNKPEPKTEPKVTAKASPKAPVKNTEKGQTSLDVETPPAKPTAPAKPVDNTTRIDGEVYHNSYLDRTRVVSDVTLPTPRKFLTASDTARGLMLADLVNKGVDIDSLDIVLDEPIQQYNVGETAETFITELLNLGYDISSLLQAVGDSEAVLNNSSVQQLLAKQQPKPKAKPAVTPKPSQALGKAAQLDTPNWEVLIKSVPILQDFLKRSSINIKEITKLSQVSSEQIMPMLDKMQELGYKRDFMAARMVSPMEASFIIAVITIRRNDTKEVYPFEDIVARCYPSWLTYKQAYNAEHES